MAEEILVTDFLSNEMIAAGKNLVEQLDIDKAAIDRAFWLYNSEEKRWKLVIISKLVDDQGPKSFYNKIVSANSNIGSQIISLNDIEAAGLNHKIAKLLGFIVGATKGIGGARLSRNTINGVFIEDVYLYR